MTEDTLCVVRTIGGLQFLFLPDGTKIPNIVWTRITQGDDDPKSKVATAIIKLFVVIADSEPIKEEQK